MTVTTAQSDTKNLFALCQPLCLEAYQPGNRDTFVSGSDSGFLVADGNRLIVAIAGSNDVSDWIDRASGNLHFRTVEMPPSLKVHAGMAAAAKAIAAVVAGDILRFLAEHQELDRCVIFTGHSRGGALAQILPLLLGMSQSDYLVVTFGSPKVISGDISQSAVHFQNWSDLVHRLPVQIRGVVTYRHFGRVVRRTLDGPVIEYAAIADGFKSTVVAICLAIVAFFAMAVRFRMLPASLLKFIAAEAKAAHMIEAGYAVERWWPYEE